MSQSQLTVFFIVVCILLCFSLAYVEVAWLRRTPQLALIWKSVTMIGLVNLIFFFVYWMFARNMGVFFFFPLPIIPVIYFFVKAGLYLLIARYSASPVYSPWLTALLTIPVHLSVGALVLAGADKINPTIDNFDEAIRTKNNALFSIELALSVVQQPYLSRRIDVAIENDNIFALKRLLAKAKVDEYDQSRFGSSESTLIITHWKLDNGVAIDKISNIDRIALLSTKEELDFFIAAGLDPKKYPTMIHAAIVNQTQAAENISAGEVQQLIEKINVLTDKGIDINTPDEYDFSVLFTALRQGENFPELIKFLLEKGCNPNTRSPLPMYPNNSEAIPAGITPLMLAAILKNSGHVKILLEHGARKTDKDSGGLTALEYARKTSAQNDLINLLR